MTPLMEKGDKLAGKASPTFLRNKSQVPWGSFEIYVRILEDDGRTWYHSLLIPILWHFPFITKQTLTIFGQFGATGAWIKLVKNNFIKALDGLENKLSN